VFQSNPSLEEISTKSLEFSEKLHGLLKIHGE
jgi:hypothetical protein